MYSIPALRADGIVPSVARARACRPAPPRAAAPPAAATVASLPQAEVLNSEFSRAVSAAAAAAARRRRDNLNDISS